MKWEWTHVKPSICLSSVPEISTPAPLQTEDGPAVAATDTMVVLFGSFWSAQTLVKRSSFFNLNFFYYLCKDDQPTPSKHLTSTKASSLTSNNAKTGTGPATSAQFLQTKTTFFFFFFCPSATSYICEQKEKKEEKKGEKAYIYTFVQKRHELRHYLCSVYTNKMSGVIWTCFLNFILLRRWLKGEEDLFLYINKNIPKKASFHNTQHVLGAQKVYGKVI